MSAKVITAGKGVRTKMNSSYTSTGSVRDQARIGWWYNDDKEEARKSTRSGQDGQISYEPRATPAFGRSRDEHRTCAAPRESHQKRVVDPIGSRKVYNSQLFGKG